MEGRVGTSNSTCTCEIISSMSSNDAPPPPPQIDKSLSCAAVFKMKVAVFAETTKLLCSTEVVHSGGAAAGMCLAMKNTNHVAT